MAVSLSLFLFVAISFAENIIINTKLGQIKGNVETKHGQQTIYSFYGIQYGVAPIGDLRFRPAQLNETKWNGIYDGTPFGNICMQPGVKAQPMSEDCLFLNIWTPKPNNTDTLLPVMFFIHGGGFVEGSGSYSGYDGTNLVRYGKDFVYVSINYRLGAFGFLTNEALYEEDGNWKSYGGMNGVYDQIQALKWTKTYISDYGGDAEQITIFGESAGGLSVCMLCISPLAKGLFSRAIIESGACTGPWGPANTSYGMEWSNEQLEKAGYPIGNLSYLRSIPALDFLHSLESFPSLWYEAVDGLVMLDEPINVYADLSNNNVLNVDKLVIGFNTMDGLAAWPWNFGSAPNDAMEYKEFIYEYVTNETQADLLLNYYYPVGDFAAYPPNHNSFQIAWYTINSDVCLSCPSLSLANQISQQNGNNIVYVYYFGGPGKNGSYYAPHGSELVFVFDNEGGNLVFEMPWSQKLANEMVSAWSNFGKYGIPNVTDSDDDVNVEWKYYDGDSNSNVMIFEDDVRLQSGFKKNYRKDVCDFWYEEIGMDTMASICADGYSSNV